jgi:hypothetical protein
MDAYEIHENSKKISNLFENVNKLINLKFLPFHFRKKSKKKIFNFMY